MLWIHILSIVVINTVLYHVLRRLGFKAEHFMFMFLVIVLTAITVIMVFKY